MNYITKDILKKFFISYINSQTKAYSGGTDNFSELRRVKLANLSDYGDADEEYKKKVSEMTTGTYLSNHFNNPKYNYNDSGFTATYRSNTKAGIRILIKYELTNPYQLYVSVAFPDGGNGDVIVDVKKSAVDSILYDTVIKSLSKCDKYDLESFVEDLNKGDNLFKTCLNDEQLDAIMETVNQKLEKVNKKEIKEQKKLKKYEELKNMAFYSPETDYKASYDFIYKIVYDKIKDYLSKCVENHDCFEYTKYCGSNEAKSLGSEYKVERLLEKILADCSSFEDSYKKLVSTFTNDNVEEIYYCSDKLDVFFYIESEKVQTTDMYFILHASPNQFWTKYLCMDISVNKVKVLTDSVVVFDKED